MGMHHYSPEIDELAQKIFDFARHRTSLDPIPLGTARTEEELAAACGPTVTDTGLGGAEALRVFTEVLHDASVQDSGRGRRIDFNLLLDSERRLADAEVAYHRATVEYAVALKNVNLETENILGYCNVQIAGPTAP